MLHETITKLQGINLFLKYKKIYVKHVVKSNKKGYNLEMKPTNFGLTFENASKTNRFAFFLIILSQQKLNSIYSNVIIYFILTPFLTLPSQPILPSPLKLENFTTPNESLMSVCCMCVCADLASLSHM